MKMKAAVLREFNKPVVIEEVELAPPKAKEVLVKTSFTGFCQSDLHFLRGRVNFGLPGVVGHEAAGIVEDVGPGVDLRQEGRPRGDHVDGPVRDLSRVHERSWLYLQKEHRDIPRGRAS